MIRYFIVTVFLLVLFPFAGKAKEGFSLSSDSSLIYYRAFGKGKPLLIINGGPGMSSEGFVGLAQTLAQHYYVIIYDQRGTGRSKLKTLDRSTITMKLMLDDLESLRKTLALESWSILGHSFGGMVASYYAAFYPDRIRRLILSSSGGVDLGLLDYFSQSLYGKLDEEAVDSIGYWNDRISRGDTSYHARLERGKLLAPAYVSDKKFVPVIAERLTQGNARVNELIWTDLHMISFNCREKLTGFSKPVLIIQGKDDVVRSETAERSKQAFKNSRVVLVEHCVHYGWLDNPEVYFREIRSFLG